MKIELHEEIEINGEDVPCTVVFECSGVWDPGVCSGPPEHCYPPEGPEIEFVRVEFDDLSNGDFEQFAADNGVSIDARDFDHLIDKAAEEYAEHLKGES